MIAPVQSEQETFLRAVFGSEQGYLFISTLDRTAAPGKGWTDRSFVYPLQLPDVLTYVVKNDVSGLDVYVAAQLYSEPNARRKEKVKACPSVWSDLDTASPWGIEPEPTVVLETSPGRWHGFWRSARLLSGAEAEELSRRIAYAHHHEGADLGGWDLTQVLRIPGTRNHKYDGWPVVRLARCESKPITDAQFAGLPQAPARRTVISEDGDGDAAAPVPLSPAEEARWKQTSTPDRSSWAMAMVSTLKERGLSDRLIEVALANHPIYLSKAREKWGNKETLIYDDIRRCIQRWKETPRIRLVAPGVATASEPAAAAVPDVWLQPISALLSQPEVPVDWMVDQLFSKGSSGWVGAEAKVGKSWLTIELLYCLTTGAPFLGHFAVPHPRKAIYIQEEDSEQRVLRRFNQLLKGTPGREWPSDDRLRFAIRSGFKIDNPQWATKLHAELSRDPVDVCVLDVFQRLHLKSENDQAQMAEVMEVLNGLTREFEVAFIIAHHYRKSQAGNEARPNQMLRGSGVLAGWSECSLYLRDGSGKNRFVMTPESKDAPAMDDLIVLREDTPNGGVRLILAESQLQEQLAEEAAVVLETVSRILNSGVDCTAQRVSIALGWSRSTAYRALEHLVDKDQLMVDEARLGKRTVKLYTLPEEIL